MSALIFVGAYLLGYAVSVRLIGHCWVRDMGWDVFPEGGYEPDDSDTRFVLLFSLFWPITLPVSALMSWHPRPWKISRGLHRAVWGR